RALSEAFAMYRSNIRIFAGIGLFTIPIGIVFNGFTFLVRENPPVEWVMKWLNDTSGARLSAAAAVGGVQQIAMLLLIAPPVIQAIDDIQSGREPGVMRSFRLGFAKLSILASALLIILASIGLLAIFVIGIPIAIWFAVSWQFFGQATILDRAESPRAALRTSRAVVRGHWFSALWDSFLFQLFALVPGPLIGALLMLLGKASVDFANAFSSVVYALTVPVAVIGLSLAYRRMKSLPSIDVSGASQPMAGSPISDALPRPMPANS
ncbi:MAG: hypothetical protein ACRDHN_13535, partial [Thermomicrobiales bacterium]